MDKLGDVGTITGGTALLVSIGGLIYTINKINGVREDLDEMTGHLATTIGEKGTLDKMNETMDKLAMAIRQLNSNVNEIATVVTEQQKIRDQQMTCILNILKEVGEVPEDTTKLLTQKMTVSGRIHRVDNGISPIPTDINQLSAKNGMADHLTKSNGDRRTTLRHMGLGT
uniref:Uncharacterized protein n=1 Tax=Pithovirus LCPAC103 TaxID=2506588 RepID=A0A481Z3E6_9VIRU|nr:MAG: hypothetical protein LCPAC103_00940 [Pithovirus LCPAC103]